MSASAPVLAALRGLPGIGKSGLAGAVGRALGWPVLDKDDIKEVVYGRTPAVDEVSYDLLFRLAQRQLQQGLSVVVDSPLRHRRLYELASRTAREAGATLVVLDCVLADAAEHRRRIETRAGVGPRAGWTIGDWSALIEYRDRTASNADYALNVPCYVVDLRLPVAEAAQLAATWLQTFGQPAATSIPRGPSNGS